ncbi:MAG: type I methionyl aminopeptidase [Erysipelotrichaceae bacterium]|nr:type I methionyl aminopeptidase [Erysipelotrichaceae bacterium]
MITIKSEREIELLREAGRVTALTIRKVGEVIKPGISTLALDKIAEKIIRENGCTPGFKGYQGFPGTLCTSINDVLVHGIPGHTILKDGDIISIDTGACYRGYNGDSCYTFAVGQVKPEVQKLLEVTEKALYIGLEQVKPGNRVGDISNAIQTYVESFGFSLPIEYTGHGIGQSLHEDPIIPNVGKPNTMHVLKKGMVICIEPMVFMGRPQNKTDADGWTVRSRDHSWGAHYEHMVVVTDDGYEILTKEE